MILAVDSGTSSTRVWLVEGREILAQADEYAGARDVARARERDASLPRISMLAGQALAEAGARWTDVEAVVAFGMITSELGLEEVPHLTAPVGFGELAAGLVTRRYEELPVPVHLVPGVRSGGDDVAASDFMRGEETEVVGLLSLGEPEPPLLYLSTGSHTKFVLVDDEGRIAWSYTTLSGELLWALHRETILAGLINPVAEPSDLSALDEGAAAVREDGLSRTLFAARLLNRVGGATPERCSAFVHGAVAAADLISLRGAAARRGGLPDRIAVGGTSPLAVAYRHLLVGETGTEPLVHDVPLGAIGARALITRVREAAPAGSPEEGN
jgi:2-dehydro-3-deoxygalactonokinase